VSVPGQKAVVVIVDGLGDLPHPALDGRTPLEAAQTPVLDRLAAAGLYGLVDPLLPGEIPNTDSGVGMLLGLAPEHTTELKRGPVEAAGAGRPLQRGEIALRANFATVERRGHGLFVVDRRAGRITEGAAELSDVLDEMDLGDGVCASFRPTDQHRGVLVLGGRGLDAAVSDTDPGDQGAPGPIRAAEALRPAAELAAEKLNRFVAEAHERLDAHPLNAARRRAGRLEANGVITRGAGAWSCPANRLRDLGLRAAVVAGCNTVLGLGALFGFSTVHRPGFTADLGTDLDGKIRAVVETLATHDVVYLHVKGADLCAHDRQPLAKRDFLERLDRELAPLATAGVVVVLSSDHTTDSNTGMHTADPVPSLLYEPRRVAGADAAATVAFGEAACRAGTMPRQRSHELLSRVLRSIGS
jgi:2,3-bisphosphoglycerate-independent phosphoglycerate mutase